MTKSIAVIIGIVLLVVLVLFSMTYTVRYNEVAIRTRFGKTGAGSIIDQAGLHLRLPLFADKITTIDTRLQLAESPMEIIQTLDQQQVQAKAYLLWQVQKDGEGPLNFFKSHPTGVQEANQWMIDQFRTAINVGLSRYAFEELVGSQSKLAAAEQTILDEMTKRAQARGIQPVSVGVSQLVLPSRTTSAVLKRMEATRAYLSEAERARGDAEASGIESRAYAQAEKIRNFAQQMAEEIRAEGNKDAARYIELMGQEPDLAIFLTSLDALQAMLSEYTTFIVPAYFDPFHLVNLDSPTDERGIPQPRARSKPGETVTVQDEAPKEKNAADGPQTARTGG
jgi:membrane protease subunit HflC